MNLLDLAPTWLQALLAAILLAAAVEDIWRNRISNLLCVAVVLLAVVAAVIVGPVPALWQNLTLCLAVLIVGMPLFGAGWLGGGDVKLIAALALWTNFAAILPLLVAVLLSGGVLALVAIAVRMMRQKKSGKGLPYAVAIASGAAIMLGQYQAQKDDPFHHPKWAQPLPESLRSPAANPAPR